MPPAQVGPDGLRALGAALGSLRDCARSGADEVLDHLPELGDRELQSTVDDYLDQVADLLREVEASVADVSGRLRVALGGAAGRADGRATGAATDTGTGTGTGTALHTGTGTGVRDRR